jgi:hypothetical protein
MKPLTYKNHFNITWRRLTPIDRLPTSNANADPLNLTNNTTKPLKKVTRATGSEIRPVHRRVVSR